MSSYETRECINFLTFNKTFNILCVPYLLIRPYKEQTKEIIDDKLVDVKLSSAKAYREGQRVLEIRLKMINELKKFKFVNLEREIKSKEESGRQQYEVFQILNLYF